MKDFSYQKDISNKKKNVIKKSHKKKEKKNSQKIYSQSK